jgi:hypothetical protein
MARAAAVTLAILLALVVPAFPDVTLTVARRSTGNGAAAGNGRERLLVSGSRLRREALSGETHLAPPGGHALSEDSGRTYLVVDPETRTWWQHGRVSSKTRRFVRPLFGQAELRPPVSVDGVVLKPLADEDGGTILGHATRRRRCLLRYRINASPVIPTPTPVAPTSPWST